MTQLLLKRGSEPNLPLLADGEPAWTLDTHRLYVGAGGVNYFVAGPGAGTLIGDGTGIPTNATGAVGSYYEDTAAGIFYGPKQLPAVEQRPTVTLLPNDAPWTGWTVGTRWQFVNAVNVTRIRYYRRASSSAALTLGMWNDDAAGVNQFRATDTRAGAVGYFEVTLPAPILVPAGGFRTFSVTGGAVPGRSPVTPVTSTADCTFSTFVHVAAADAYPSVVTIDWAYWVEPIFEPASTWPVAVRRIPQFSAILPGMVPASAGGTANFLRADGAWAPPPVTAIADTATIDLTLSGGSISGVTRQQMSITSDAGGLKLVNDLASPGNSMIYATTALGVKGWRSIVAVIGEALALLSPLPEGAYAMPRPEPQRTHPARRGQQQQAPPPAPPRQQEMPPPPEEEMEGEEQFAEESPYGREVFRFSFQGEDGKTVTIVQYVREQEAPAGESAG